MQDHYGAHLPVIIAPARIGPEPRVRISWLDFAWVDSRDEKLAARLGNAGILPGSI